MTSQRKLHNMRHMIRYERLTSTQKLADVSLVYCMEPKQKQKLLKEKETKNKNWICSEEMVNGENL